MVWSLAIVNSWVDLQVGHLTSISQRQMPCEKTTVFELSRSWPDLIRNAVSACSKAKYFGTVITTMGWWENRKHPKSGGKKPWVFCSSLKAMNSRWEWGDMGWRKYVRSKYIKVTDVLHPNQDVFSGGKKACLPAGFLKLFCPTQMETVQRFRWKLIGLANPCCQWLWWSQLAARLYPQLCSPT